MNSPTTGLLLSDDLIFTSRITGTARDLGCTVHPARSVEALREAFARQRPACVILDLSNPGLVIIDLMKWFAEQGEPIPRVVAYGSHVDTATLRGARAAGCDPVMPRSQFVEELPKRLSVWMEQAAGE
jgi:CheY-like chemotaxis protein